VLSIIYVMVRWLLGAVVVILGRQASKDVDLLVLRHENAVLRRQVGMVRHTGIDRLWAALSRLVPRQRWTQVFAVTPARSRRRSLDQARRSRPGERPPPHRVSGRHASIDYTNPNCAECQGIHASSGSRCWRVRDDQPFG